MMFRDTFHTKSMNTEQQARGESMNMNKYLILDTDIGNDIDDHWALAMMLRTPGMEPDLIVTASGDTPYRAAVTRHFLKNTGFSHIPVAAGELRKDQNIPETLRHILPEDALDRQEVCDGVERMIAMIEKADSVTIVAIGALTNIAQIAQRRPDLTKKCRIVAMSGSYDGSFMDKPGRIPEFNVYSDCAAAKIVYSTQWQDLLLTPLDHCGALVMDGADYQKVFTAKNPVAKELIATYHDWTAWLSEEDKKGKSSILFDTAAVKLATPGGEESSVIREMRIAIADDGSWVEEDSAPVCRVALAWKDRAAYISELAAILGD